jgi:hypothetical protein
MQPGAKIGRTDPAKDPKRALTVEFLNKAGKPELVKIVLDHASVLPEEMLVQKTLALIQFSGLRLFAPSVRRRCYLQVYSRAGLSRPTRVTSLIKSAMSLLNSSSEGISISKAT